MTRDDLAYQAGQGRSLHIMRATSLGRNAGHKLRRVAAHVGIDPTETPENRHARRKTAGVVFGALGAVFVLLIGEPFGSVVFGFLVFGAIGVLAAPLLTKRYFASPAKSTALVISAG